MSEYSDWMAAAKAKKIDTKLMLMNIAGFAQPGRKKEISKRQRTFDQQKNEQLLLLGENPFEVDKELIQKSRQKLKQQKIMRVKNNARNNKTNCCKTTP